MNLYRQIIPPGFGHTSKIYKISNEYFIVIPKNASNTILFGSDFAAKEVNISEFSSKISINIFFREPLDRFKSSLIESIKRCSLFNNGRLISNFSSVPVSNDIKKIYANVFDSFINEPYNFLITILEILENSFYDPHLCPQWFFFTSLDRKVISKLNIYDLKNMDQIMSEMLIPIKKNFNLKSSFDTEKYLNIKENTFKIIKKRIKNKLNMLDNKFINFYHSLKYLEHISIKQSEPVFNFLHFDQWLIISKKIHEIIDNDSELKRRILEIYKEDVQIYSQIIKNKKLIIPENKII